MNKEDQISNAADVSPMSANSQSGSSFQIMTKTSFKETIFQPASDIGRKNSIKRTQTELGSNKALSPIQIQDVEVFITKPVESRLLTKAEK